MNSITTGVMRWNWPAAGAGSAVAGHRGAVAAHHRVRAHRPRRPAVFFPGHCTPAPRAVFRRHLSAIRLAGQFLRLLVHLLTAGGLARVRRRRRLDDVRRHDRVAAGRLAARPTAGAGAPRPHGTRLPGRAAPRVMAPTASFAWSNRSSHRACRRKHSPSAPCSRSFQDVACSPLLCSLAVPRCIR